MKVTIHLNDADGAYIDGFTPSKAVLADAGTYELPATQYIPDAHLPGHTHQEGLDNQELYIRDVLNHVYDQLNVGGDLIPAEEFTTAYRDAGHRSLSVGDLVTIEDDSRYTGYRGTWAVDRYGFKRVLGANVAIRRGVQRAARRGALAW